MQIGILLGYGVRGSGSTIYAMDLARSLARIGHDVRLLCHEPDPSRLSRHGKVHDTHRWGLRCEDALNAKLKVHSYLPETVPVTYPRPEIPFGTLLYRMNESMIDTYVEEVLSWLVAENEELAFDLLLVNHLALMSVVASEFHIKTAVPYRIIVHGTGLIYGVHKSDLIRHLVTEATERAERIIVLNDSVEKRVLRVFPELEQKCLRVPPGTDTRRFNFNPGRPKSKKLAYIGRITMDKGLHCLLAAIPKIVEQVPGVEVIFSGNGTDFQGLRKAWAHLESGEEEIFFKTCESLAHATRSPECANKLLQPLRAFVSRRTKNNAHLARKAAGSVQWLGDLDRAEVARLLKESRVNVLPSLVPEAHPLVVCEALASGNPVVGTDSAGIRTILKGLELTVPALQGRLRVSPSVPDFIPRLAIQCASLLNSPPTIREQIETRQFVRDSYEWETASRMIVAGASTTKILVHCVTVNSHKENFYA